MSGENDNGPVYIPGHFFVNIKRRDERNDERIDLVEKR